MFSFLKVKEYQCIFVKVFSITGLQRGAQTARPYLKVPLAFPTPISSYGSHCFFLFPSVPLFLTLASWYVRQCALSVWSGRNEGLLLMDSPDTAQS